MFLLARNFNKFTYRTVDDDALRQLYDLDK